MLTTEAGHERRLLGRRIAQLQRDERCVQRVVTMIVPFPVVALTIVAYGAILHPVFPYNGFELAFRLLCEVLLASVICLVALTTLRLTYRMKLNWLRQEYRQLITRFLGSYRGEPPIPTLPGGVRASPTRKLLQGAAKSGVIPAGYPAIPVLRLTTAGSITNPSAHSLARVTDRKNGC
jgi:hypothetical protein